MDVKFIVEVTIDGVKRNLSYQEARQLYDQLHILFGRHQLNNWDSFKWAESSDWNKQKFLYDNVPGYKIRGIGDPVLTNQSND